MGSYAQVISFHPVKVSPELLDSFLDVETNHMKKIAQDAVEKGDLVGWRLLELFNPSSDDYNYMFVNIYKDFDAATSPKALWWNNAEQVLGVKTSILFDNANDFSNSVIYIGVEQTGCQNTGIIRQSVFKFAVISPASLRF